MKKFISLGLAAAMALSLTACGGSSSETTAAAAGETGAAESAEAGKGTEAAGGTEAADNGGASSEGTFKIGMIGPLTGGAAAYGLGVKNAVELAVEEINAGGGINGYQVECNGQDDEHDPEKSVNAYNTLKDWGMQFLVGSVTSKPCIAVAAESAADNLFQLTPSGSAVECIAEDNAFRVCFSDPDQGKASAQYIAKNNLATKIGVIYDSSTEYSTGIFESFQEEAANQGLEIVAEEAFTADNATDFSVQIDNCKEAGAELMFMPFYYTEASTVLKQCADKDYKPIFFGVDGMDGILSVENFDTSLAEGVMLLTPFSVDEETSKDFVAAFQAKFNDMPNQFAADAYDAVYAIKAAAEKADLTPDMETSDICDAMKVAMTEISIDGLTGVGMTWNAAGEPDKEPKAAMIVDGAYVMQ